MESEYKDVVSMKGTGAVLVVRKCLSVPEAYE
jgi:hypothetical protein